MAKEVEQLYAELIENLSVFLLAKTIVETKEKIFVIKTAEPEYSLFANILTYNQLRLASLTHYSETDTLNSIKLKLDKMAKRIGISEEMLPPTTSGGFHIGRRPPIENNKMLKVLKTKTPYDDMTIEQSVNVPCKHT